MRDGVANRIDIKQHNTTESLLVGRELIVVQIVSLDFGILSWFEYVRYGYGLHLHGRVFDCIV